jgi:hypothetical protein
MCQGVLIDLFLLCPQLLDNVSDFERIPIQDRIGHQAEATGLVHDFLVIPRREFPLIGKENPAGELMAIFAFVELELDPLPQVAIGQVTQDVLGLENASQVGLNIAKLSRTAKGQHFAVKAYFRQSWG